VKEEDFSGKGMEVKGIGWFCFVFAINPDSGVMER
jgi:hypothetical protein